MTTIHLPAGLLLATKQTANIPVQSALQDATRDPNRGTWAVTIPQGLELAARAAIHDGLQQQLADEPANRHATYQRMADRAMNSLLA